MTVLKTTAPTTPTTPTSTMVSLKQQTAAAIVTKKVSLKSSPSSTTVSLAGAKSYAAVVGGNKIKLSSPKKGGAGAGAAAAATSADGGVLGGKKRKKSAGNAAAAAAGAATASTTAAAPSTKRLTVNAGIIGAFEDSEARRQDRAQRFASQSDVVMEEITPPPTTGGKGAKSKPGMVKLHSTTPSPRAIRGTNQNLEKSYHRENAKTARIEDIRPVEVLVRSLQMVKKSWIEVGNYQYCGDQLKSIQQDLMLQHIETPLTVDAYESHARLALENHDLQELHRCLLRLVELYPSVPHPPHRTSHEAEFTSYRLITLLHEPQTALQECSRLLRSLPKSIRTDPDMAFAQRVLRAFFSRSTSDFWTLYLTAPKMAGFAMDVPARFLRLEILQGMCKAAMGSLPVSFLQSSLGFTKDEETKQFLKRVGCIFSSSGNEIDVKQSKESLRT